MHPVRKAILFQLSNSETITFTKLKPKDIESNLFIYHLKQLINEGIIKKRQDGLYELTLEGYVLMSKTSRINFRVREQPHIFTMIVTKNNKGEYLIYKRYRQPFLGLKSFVYGKLHIGEKIHDAANREFKEKTNLKGDLKYIGQFYEIIYKNKTLLTHVLMHVFLAKNVQGKLLSKGPAWECFWDKLEKIDTAEFNPGFPKIVNLIENYKETPFFEEFECGFDSA